LARALTVLNKLSCYISYLYLGDPKGSSYDMGDPEVSSCKSIEKRSKGK